jgi:hypothetical protein
MNTEIIDTQQAATDAAATDTQEQTEVEALRARLAEAKADAEAWQCRRERALELSYQARCDFEAWVEAYREDHDEENLHVWRDNTCMFCAAVKALGARNVEPCECTQELLITVTVTLRGHDSALDNLQDAALEYVRDQLETVTGEEANGSWEIDSVEEG